MDKPLWLISYDVSHPKRLRRIYRYCSQYGWPLQKSVFVFALNKAEKAQACQELIDLLDSDEDKLLCIPFNPTAGSFHLMPPTDLVIAHDDPRLARFVQ